MIPGQGTKIPHVCMSCSMAKKKEGRKEERKGKGEKALYKKIFKKREDLKIRNKIHYVLMI